MIYVTDENLFWLFATPRVYRVRYNNPNYMSYAPRGTDPVDLRALFEHVDSMHAIAVIKTGSHGVYDRATYNQLLPRTKFYMGDLDELIKMRLIFGASIQVHVSNMYENTAKHIWRDIDDGTDCTI